MRILSLLGLVVATMGYGASQASADFQTQLRPLGGASGLNAHHFALHAQSRSMSGSAAMIHASQVQTPPIQVLPGGGGLTDASLTYLLNRRALNPTRFDHFHPLLGPTLGDVGRVQAGLCPPSGSLVNSLLARRLINPTRFDHFHPTLGPLLNQDNQLRSAVCQPCPPVNGILPTTASFNYLRWRRSLNPARFDHYHPNIGPLLALDQQLRSNPNANCMPTPPTPTPTSPTPTPTSPQIVLPPPSPSNTGGTTPPLPPLPPAPPPSPGVTGVAVPEPSALALLLVGLSLAAPHFLRRRRAG